MEEMARVNSEVVGRSKVGGGSGKQMEGSASQGLLTGFDLPEGTTDKEELTKMVEHIQKTIGAETVRLKKLKTDHNDLIQHDQAQQMELD